MLRRGGSRVAGGAVGVVVLHGPAELGTLAVAQDGVVGRALLGGRAEILRLAHAHELRRQRQHHRSLDLARVHAEAVLLRAELRARVAQRQVEPAHAVDDEAVRRAQLARHDVHRAHVAAVRVEQHQLLHAGARHARADLVPQADQRLGRQRERARRSARARGSGRSAGSAGTAPAARPAAAAATAATMPSASTVSTPSGRCGPCCSVAPSGSTATVVAASSAAKSRVVSRDQKQGEQRRSLGAFITRS